MLAAVMAPSFGSPGGRRVRCGAHKLADMLRARLAGAVPDAPHDGRLSGCQMRCAGGPDPAAVLRMNGGMWARIPAFSLVFRHCKAPSLAPRAGALSRGSAAHTARLRI